MDWKIFPLLLLAVHMGYGQPTCETNPNDKNCYCVLDPTKDTDNWFLARSYCRDEVNGTLVDINAADTNTFVQNMLQSASVSSAWLGVNDLNGVLSIVSGTPLSYRPSPTWDTQTGASCTAVNAANGNWDSLQCKGSSNIQTTICRVPPSDQTGYSIETGCPLNAHVYEGKCYQAFSLSTSDLDGMNGYLNAMKICSDMTPAGKLILPTSDAETEFIRTLAQLTEFDKFWLYIEYHGTGENFREWGVYSEPYLIYQNWDNSSLASFMILSDHIKSASRVVMNINTGYWESVLPATYGVMCVLDIATPGVAVKSPFCPSALTVVTPPVSPSTSASAVKTTPAATTTSVVDTTPAPTSTPPVEITPAPTSKPAVESTHAPAPTETVNTTPASTPTTAVDTMPVATPTSGAETTPATTPTSGAETTPATPNQSEESPTKGFIMLLS